MKNSVSTRYITVTAMFAALAYAAMLLGKLIALAVPPVAGFLSYDPKDAVIVIAGFILGPATGFAVSFLVSAIEMITVSGTGLYGFVMNVISTCAFALPAALIYKHRRTRVGALAGLACGVAAMAAVMLMWNYIITPVYMNVPREVVAKMLLPTFLPFNLIKGGLNAALTFIVYKPVVGALRKAKLVDPSESSGAKPKYVLVTVVCALIVAAGLVLSLLALTGVI